MPRRHDRIVFKPNVAAALGTLAICELLGISMLTILLLKIEPERTTMVPEKSILRNTIIDAQF